MTDVTTKDAFQQMINTRGIHKILGLTSVAVRTMRASFKKHGFGTGGVSLGRAEELLENAGYLVVQEKLWRPRSEEGFEKGGKVINPGKE